MWEPRKQNFDIAWMLSATDRLTAYVDRCKRLTADVDREKRLAKQECRACYYASARIGGAALTQAECGSCKTVMQFGNTCTDVLCAACAKRLGACHHCGASMDEKMRRKLERV